MRSIMVVESCWFEKLVLFKPYIMMITGSVDPQKMYPKFLNATYPARKLFGVIGRFSLRRIVCFGTVRYCWGIDSAG